MLQLAVRHYVDTMEPVGSQTLVRRFGLGASPATVRSAMGALEQRGLLTQPHPSAGRIPSQQGYRTYVNQLLPAPGAAALQLERELTGLSLQWAALDDLLLHLSRRLADLRWPALPVAAFPCFASNGATSSILGALPWLRPRCMPRSLPGSGSTIIWCALASPSWPVRAADSVRPPGA